MSWSPPWLFQLTCNHYKGRRCGCEAATHICSELSCCVSDSVAEMWRCAETPRHLFVSRWCETIAARRPRQDNAVQSPVSFSVTLGEYERCAFHSCSLWCFYIRKAAALNTFFFIFRCILGVRTSQPIDLTHSVSAPSTGRDRKRAVGILQFVHNNA